MTRTALRQTFASINCDHSQFSDNQGLFREDNAWTVRLVAMGFKEVDEETAIILPLSAIFDKVRSLVSEMRMRSFWITSGTVYWINCNGFDDCEHGD